jgi:hypothetical protein
MSLRERVEQKSHDLIWEIADQLNIDVPFFPEVYPLSPDMTFPSLCLPSRYRSIFLKAKKTKRSMYLHKPKIILSGRGTNSKGEEEGHFLHDVVTSTRKSNRTVADSFAIHALEEMWGFFCSRLVNTRRVNRFAKYGDFLPKDNSNLVHVLDCLKDSLDSDRDFVEFFVYQQGYGLGSRLALAYDRGEIPLSEIRKSFSESLNGDAEPLLKFLRLKYEVLN